MTKAVPFLSLPDAHSCPYSNPSSCGRRQAERYLCKCTISCSRKMIWVKTTSPAVEKNVWFIADSISLCSWTKNFAALSYGVAEKTEAAGVMENRNYFLAAVFAYVSWKHVWKCSLTSELWLAFNRRAVWEEVILRLNFSLALKNWGQISFFFSKQLLQTRTNANLIIVIKNSTVMMQKWNG